MHWLDWLIVIAYLVYITYDGLRLTKRSNEVEGYFLANRSLPWWAVGLSVMATQLSAITLVGTTGQAYADGMRFIQFYFGLPLAMVILCMTVVPFFYRAKVYTAYEYLEKRFDAKTRAMASAIFLLQRGLSCGVIIAAPSVVLSIVFGWNKVATILTIGVAITLYTMFGGVQAVTWVDVKQMIVIFVGLSVCLVIIIGKFPAGISITDALHIASAAGRLKTVDTQFSLKETYTLWSGLIGGLFLAMSYFGCDQSQVQRYLTARSLSQSRTSLLMSAFIKIPMQFMILFIGVMVFVFYQFQKPPLIFNKVEAARVTESAHHSQYQSLLAEYDQAHAARARSATEYAVSNSATDRAKFIAANHAVNQARQKVGELVKQATASTKFNDVNYIFPTFVTTYLPTGFVGLIIAAIFAAAMSASSGELNALATTTVMDIYRRHYRKQAADAHYLKVAKIATTFWGLFACVVAYFAAQQGSLIEVVNKFGSYFYGSMLGVFVLALASKRATGNGAFFGLIAGVASVAVVATSIEISFLWYNVIGCVVVVVIGMIISLFDKKKSDRGGTPLTHARNF